MHLMRFVPLALFLLLTACRDEIDPGFYLANTESVNGVVQVTFDGEAFLYEDEGSLFSDPVSIQLEKVDSTLTTVRFVDGRSFDVALTPYVTPDFLRPSGTPLYRSPQYQYKERHGIPYGQALGFWTSYPGRNENALITFGRKTLEWLSKRKTVGLEMDLYYPIDDHADSRPLLLLIHGGAFFNGDKETEGLVRWAQHFASLGYVVSSINYRIGFRPTPNEVERAGYRAVQDANAAVRFLLKADSLSIDPRLVFVAGTSAGAITALNLAYMMDKDRPEITRGGLVGDEGRIDAIVPPDSGRVSVRAVGNLWGAVNDTAMLFNRRIPVISFHSENDPIVPYKSEHPFGDLFNPSEMPLVRAILSALPLEGDIQLNKLVFPMMHGSYVVDRVLRSQGVHSELHTSHELRHTLHVNDADEIIPEVFQEIQDAMEAFFSSEMAPCPISLHQDQQNPQLFHIDASEVERCYWRAEGGVILEKTDNTVRVLMLSGFPEHSVSASGLYRSGMAFYETVKVD